MHSPTSLSAQLICHRAEIQALFDKQIAGIIKKIDAQLNWMQGARPSDRVVSLFMALCPTRFSVNPQLRGISFSQADSGVQLI
jgi:hypothetical protein